MKKQKKLVAGVAGIERRTDRTEVGPFKNLDQKNKFKLTQQLSLMSPHIFIPILKMSLTIIKGFRFTSTNSAKQEEYETWAKTIGLRNKIQMLVYMLCRDGTYIATITNTSPELFDFEPALMQNISILPEGYDPNKGSSVILAPPIEKFVINEGIQDAEEEKSREEIVYGVLYPRTGIIKDTKGRETYGLYGQSMLDSIEDVLYKYLDVIEGYSNYIHRYGYGKLAIMYDALEEFIKEGDIDSAIEALDKLAEEHATIEENEDIVGAGFRIQELNTGGSNPNVTQWKESLEKDIQIGLLQAPLTMGRAEGTTFASGYISEEDRMVALEGIQNIVTDIVNNEIIRRRENLQPGQPLEIEIEFEELSKPKVEIKDLNEACANGWISIEEWRRRTGFPAKRNESETYMQQATGQVPEGGDPTGESGTKPKAQNGKTSEESTKNVPSTAENQKSLNNSRPNK